MSANADFSFIVDSYKRLVLKLQSFGLEVFGTWGLVSQRWERVDATHGRKSVVEGGLLYISDPKE